MPPKVRLTHPDRIYWPDAGITKQGLADYYAAVWPRIAPHVTLRPLALLRCPGGTGEAGLLPAAWKGHGPQILTPPDPLNADDPPLIAVDGLPGLTALFRAPPLIFTAGSRASPTSSTPTRS